MLSMEPVTKTNLITYSAYSNRWKEVLDAAVGGGVSQIQTLVEKMPDVAEVKNLEPYEN